MPEKLFGPEVQPWDDLKRLHVKFIYVVAEDENGYLTRARGLVLPGKEEEALRTIRKDVKRFLDEAKRGETRWEP